MGVGGERLLCYSVWYMMEMPDKNLPASVSLFPLVFGLPLRLTPSHGEKIEGSLRGQQGSVGCWRWKGMSESMSPPPGLREQSRSRRWKECES